MVGADGISGLSFVPHGHLQLRQARSVVCIPPINGYARVVVSVFDNRLEMSLSSLAASDIFT